jgi:hypothetical protein
LKKRNATKNLIKFPISEEFQSSVHYVPAAHNNRSAAEFLDSSLEYIPIAAEKNTLAFWHPGFHSVTGWRQRNAGKWIPLCRLS